MWKDQVKYIGSLISTVKFELGHLTSLMRVENVLIFLLVDIYFTKCPIF